MPVVIELFSLRKETICDAITHNWLEEKVKILLFTLKSHQMSQIVKPFTAPPPPPSGHRDIGFSGIFGLNLSGRLMSREHRRQ